MTPAPSASSRRTIAPAGLSSRVLARKLSAAIILVSAAASAGAGDWPGWRGPRGDGSADDASVPLHWNATENIRWHVPIPGIGHSSPVVIGEHIFITTCLEKTQERLLICLERRTGRVLWQREVVHARLEP